MKLSTVYDASAHEKEIYKLWEASGLFIADPSSSKEHFSIPMPPPNETGTLHIGHALGMTIQDILARHARLQGKDVLWLPGTDHSAIATNAIIEEQLRQEGTTKHEIGRAEFLKRTKEFVANSRGTINKQIRSMGASVDWSRARYTLDESLSRCVNEVFVKMYNDGLIYRGNRIVNWDPKLETNVSDDEVEYTQEKSKLYTFKYGPFEIATARPETKFGDKYVLIHPDDKRYAKYKHGDKLEVDWINGKITATVIKDAAVDPKFGTGVMTITPWHSLVDYEIAERHGLDREQIIDLKGRLLPIAGEFEGLTIEEARPKIVKKMDQMGLLVKVDDNYLHNVALNSRGKGVIEPQIRLQWFIDVNKPAVNWKGQKMSLKQVMQDVIRAGDIKINPARFEKVYFHWIDNLRDWCISRQIWWGHQIPVWYKKGAPNDKAHVGVLPPKDAENWQRDPDTLDTWFSAALWTWSTLIDPKLVDDYGLTLEDMLRSSPDFLSYHPASILETGWDILFFWVARMILATTYATGQIPFKNVYLHGLVLSPLGGKMSKSKPESIIDPMEVIDEFGTDSLRLALVQGMSAGNDQKLVKSKVITNRNFANKLWNVARYIQNVSPEDDSDKVEPKDIADHWIIGQLISTKDQVNSDLNNYRFSDAYNKLYHFLWDDLADWYIEASKVNPNKPILRYVLKNVLVITHPLAPYLTEVIWQSLDYGPGLLAGETYRKVISHDAHEAIQFEKLKTVISETRRILHGLGEKNVTMSYKPIDILDKNRTLIMRLSGVSKLKPTTQGSGLKLTGTSLNIWLDIDKSKTKNYVKKLDLKLSELQGHIDRLTSRLNNKNYTSQAPADIVADSQSQLKEYEDLKGQVESERKLFNDL